MKSHKFVTWYLGVALLMLALGIGYVLAEETSAKDPILYEYVQGTLNSHPLMEQARAQLAAAEARATGKSRPLYNPELELGYENAESLTKTIGISQTFDLFGKRKSQKRVGIAEVDAASAAFDITGKTLLGDLLTAIANYRTNEKLFQVASQRVDLTEDFLKLAERQYQAGDLPLNELLTARLALSEARAEKNEASLSFTEAKADLVAIVGLERGFWPQLPSTVPSLLPNLDSVRLADLPELRYALAAIQINRSLVRVAKRNQMPDPTLGVSVGEENSSTLVGLRFSVPIPVLNSFRAEVEAAGADVIAAEQSYQALRLEMQAGLEAAQEQFASSLEAWRDWESVGASHLQDQRALLQRLWGSGEISAVEFLIQLNQTFSAESAAIRLEGRLWTTWFQWLETSATADQWMETLR